jgi:hypothetical protein
MHISLRNHTSARSFFVDLSTDLPLGPLLDIRVDVTSNMQIHEIRVKIPADSRHALATTLISAFRNLNQLVVHAGEEPFNSGFDTLLTISKSQTHMNLRSSSRLTKSMSLRHQR